MVYAPLRESMANWKGDSMGPEGGHAPAEGHRQNLVTLVLVPKPHPPLCVFVQRQMVVVAP